MHGAMMTSRGKTYRTVFCGKYNREGKEACKCHRVRHDVLEGIVKQYLETLPTRIDKLLAEPILDTVDLTDEARAYQGVCCDMLSFEAEHGETGNYDEIYSRVLPQVHADLAAKNAELDNLIESYANLPKAVQHKINGKLELLQAEIDDLERQTVNLRIPRDEAYSMLQRRKQEALEAIQAINTDIEYRAMTEALRLVIDRIVLHHRYSPAGKSILEFVEIVPVSGVVTKVTMTGLD